MRVTPPPMATRFLSISGEVSQEMYFQAASLLTGVLAESPSTRRPAQPCRPGPDTAGTCRPDLRTGPSDRSAKAASSCMRSWWPIRRSPSSAGRRRSPSSSELAGAAFLYIPCTFPGHSSQPRSSPLPCRWHPSSRRPRHTASSSTPPGSCSPSAAASRRRRCHLP